MTIRLKELPAVLARNYAANINTFIHGQPGIGKTDTVNAFAERMREKLGKNAQGADKFVLKTFYAPTLSPMDIQASAPDAATGLLRMYNNEALPNAYVDPTMEGVLFLGELPNTDPATAKLLQKYINGEDMSGCLKKPVGIRIIADGNRISDKSGVQNQGRAFLSRFAHIEVYSTADDNIAYAQSHEWHPFIQTFFHEQPALIDNYDEVFGNGVAAKGKQGAAAAEEAKSGIWASMRAWERLSRLEKAVEGSSVSLMLEEVAGNLGSAVGAQYCAHKEMIGKLASFDQIIADPEKVKLPQTHSESYALSTLVALRCKTEHIKAVRAFATRMSPEIQVVILKHMVERKDLKLISNREYSDWVMSPAIAALLNGK